MFSLSRVITTNTCRSTGVLSTGAVRCLGGEGGNKLSKVMKKRHAKVRRRRKLGPKWEVTPPMKLTDFFNTDRLSLAQRGAEQLPMKYLTPRDVVQARKEYKIPELEAVEQTKTEESSEEEYGKDYDFM